MTKKQWRDFLRNIVDPSNSSKRFLPQMCEWALAMAYNEYVQSIPPYLYDDNEFLVKEFLNQVPVLDATRNLYYLTLPATLVPMKPPSEAVRRIACNEDNPGFDYVPCTETVWELMDGLFSHDTTNSVGYIVRYDKIWFADNLDAATAAAGIRVVLAVPFNEFSDDEEVNLPAGNINIIQLATQILMNTQPMDQKNNNAK